MFFGFFLNKKNRISKIEYWNKWELFDLISDLHKAEKLLSRLNSGDSNDFLLLKEFREKFVEEIYELEHDNVPNFNKIWIWFAPASNWESFTGELGVELGEQIFRRVDKWKRNHDFVHGTKVCLRGEYGVVIKAQFDKPDFCGVIRWDTNKESDKEDWRGMFGTFIDQGGEIVNPKYQFKFINDDGTLKE